MKYRNYLLILLLTSLFGCKKQKQNPEPQKPVVRAEVSYTLSGAKLKPSDPSALAVDVNNDGKPDIYFYTALTSESVGVRLYFGTSALGSNFIKMGEHDDNLYLNVADVVPYRQGAYISTTTGGKESWDGEFGLITLKTQYTAFTDWSRLWSTGSDYMLAVKLDIGGAPHYGWVRVQVNKDKEELTVIDYGYNLLAGEALYAGVH